MLFCAILNQKRWGARRVDLRNEKDTLIHLRRLLPPTGECERMDGIDLPLGNKNLGSKEIVDRGKFADRTALGLQGLHLGNVELGIALMVGVRRLLLGCAMVVTTTI